MTTIHSLPDEHVTESTSRGQGNSTQQKAKWLYELERAQWNQQSIPKPQHQARPREAVSDTDHSARNRSIQFVRESGADLESSSRATQSAQATASSPPRTSPLSYAPVTRDAPETALPATVTASTLRAMSGAAMPADNVALMTSWLGTFSVDRRWEKLRAHMEEKDGQLSLWLRDTRIDESQGVQLAITLKKHFAELGKHLAQFTLNGKLLSLEPQTQQSNVPK